MKKKNQNHIHNQAPPATTAMDLRKHPFLDHFLAAMPSKRRVLCVFVLGVAASFCVVSLLASMNSPAAVWSSPSSLFTCFFSASRCIHFTRSNDSSSSAVSSNSSLTDNNAAASQGGASASGSGNGTSLSEALEGNFSRPVSDSGSVKSHQWSSPNSSISNTDAINKTLFDKIQAGSPCAEVNKSVSGNLTSRDACATPSAQTGTKGEVTSEEHESFRNSSSGNFNESNAYVKAVDGVSLKKCDIYDGRWVRDLTKPHYPPGSCPYIDVDFDCFKNGRPDDEFLRWKWKPYGCDIPSLNATDFLKRLRGNRILFVGDSLNRNMWESLVCILHNSIKNKSRVFEVSGRREFKMQGYYSFRFEDYMCSIDFVRSPFLVKEQFLKTANGSEDERLRLDLLDETKAAYLQADIVVFNSGHWWTHEKTSSGIRYYQEGNYVYPVLEVLKAYEKALNTWAGWVDRNIDSNKTQIVFRGYSLTHFRGGQWNSGGQCHKEIEPIYNETFINKYPEKMIALEGVLHKMETPVLYLNISRLTDYRKDGHPSIYRKKYSSAEEHVAAEKIQDCSHWCLPGVPDTWNELLYASLLMEGKGPWKQ